MKYRNVFGDLEYELGDFFVLNRKDGTGKYAVSKRESSCIGRSFWIVDDPMWCPGGVAFGDRPPRFDSFIQAVSWLKANVNDLL